MFLIFRFRTFLQHLMLEYQYDWKIGKGSEGFEEDFNCRGRSAFESDLGI